MANIEQHCKESEVLFGKDFWEVHTWLDSYAVMFPPRIHGTKHREFRHNAEGVEFIRKKWGEVAAKAAQHHIDRDNGAFFEVPREESRA